jgi:ferric-dicitrate binding protein FerR (iron transport regulator)
MSDKFTGKPERDTDDETIARLFRLAGRSQSVPSEIEARVYDRVLQEWQACTVEPDSAHVYSEVRREWSKTASRSAARRWFLPVALAASAVLAVIVFTQPAQDVSRPLPVGTIVKITGATDDLQFVGAPVFSGTTLETGGDGGISVALQNAESLRLDANSELVINANDEFALVEGRVYVDTGDFMYRDKGVVIDTRFGAVSDVGTQFSVNVSADLLDVGVREGRVDVQSSGQELVAVAGERLLLEEGKAAHIGSLQPHDAYWDWVADLAPAYDLENRSLLDFLRWAARETGRELEFEDNELRMAAMRTDLHGSVADFTPVEAVRAVMSTTTFRYRIETNKIVIYRGQ